jgi:hypothetical protein
VTADPAAVALAIFSMGQCVTRDAAQGWANIAAHRGATPAQLAAAWADWERLQDMQVQTVVAR